MTTAVLSQSHFRGRTDSNSVDTAPDWAAAIDTNFNFVSGGNFRIRFTVQETAGGNPAAATVKLQASRNAGAFFDVTTSSTIVKAVDASSSAEDTSIATQRLTGTGTYVAGRYSEDGSPATTVDLAASNNTEWEFGIQIVDADVAANDTIDLKVVAVSGTAIGIAITPRVTVVKPDTVVRMTRTVVLATAIALAWVPPDPLPTLPRNLSPAIPGQSVDSPPLALPQENPQNVAVVHGEWWKQPAPLPTMPGKVAALIALAADNPPFSHPERTPQLYAIVGQSQANPWTYNFNGNLAPFMPRRMAPGIPGQSVDPPPFTHPERQASTAAIKAQSQPESWTYNFAGNSQPYQGKQLAPGIPGQSIDPPPSRHPEQLVVTTSIKAAWQPEVWTYNFAGGLQPYAPRQLNPSITAVPVDPPPDIGWPKIVVVDDVPLPQTAAKVAALLFVAATADNPPFTHPERTAATLAIKAAAWQPDPWTYAELGPTGGLQPYGPKLLDPGIPGLSVDPPPFTLGGPIALPAELVSLAQPTTWPYSFVGGAQPYAPRTLSPGIPGQSVDAPPVVHPERDPVIIAGKAAWQPDPWVYNYLGPAAGLQPYAPRLNGPSTTAVRVDDPPFTLGGPVAIPAEIVAANQPASWPYAFIGSAQPYGPRRLNPQITTVAVDPPPGGGWPRIVTLEDVPLPQQTRGIAALLAVAAPINDPPFTLGGPVAIEASVVAASQPDPWSYRYLGPAGGLQPYGPRLLNPALLAVQVDDPPFTRRRVLDPASWWLPDPPLPQQSPKLVQPFTADTVPSSRPWLSAVLSAWADPAPLPQQRGALSPGIPGQSVDSPPPRQTRPITWPVVEPLPQLTGKLSPGIPGQSVDNPPARQVKPVTWPAPDPQPQSAGKLSPAVPGQSVDNPPFVHRERTLSHIALLAQCQPERWVYSFQGGLQPYDYRKLPQGQAIFDPPFTYGGPYALPAELVAIAQPNAWTYTFAGGLQPFAPRRLSPSVLAVAVDNPPFDSRALSLRAELVALWQPVDLAPTLPRPGVVPEPSPEPAVVTPPPGGGDYPRHLKKPLRPIWDRKPEQPAPEIVVESAPAKLAPAQAAPPQKPTKPAPLRSFDGLAQALTPPQPAPAPQAEVPALERRRLARLDLVEASDRTAVVEQDDHVTAKASVEASAELRHTEPDDQLSAVGFVAIAASLRHHDDDDKLVALVVHEASDDIENDDEEVIALLLQQL